MAFYTKLTEGWMLSDGILPESLLEKPASVYEALREAGRIPDAEKGLNAMECEWIALRRWTYSLLLEMPGEDDERIYLELPKVEGEGCAYLNGEEIGAFRSGAVRLELTGAMKQEGLNELEICFEPTLHARPGCLRPLPETGILCAPVLRTANFATVEKLELSSRTDGEDGVIELAFEVNAHTAGKYTFQYALMLDDEAAGQEEFYEKLPAARRKIRHEIRIKNAALLDRSRLEETVYGIKFTLERGGVGCDVRHMETAFRSEKPVKCVSVSEWPVSGDTIDRIVGLGADGIVLSGMPENAFEKNDFLAGLTVVPDGNRIGAEGMLTAAAMERYAAGESIWPMESAAWRLRGGKAPEDGANCGLAADSFAKARRFLQAECVSREAQRKRRERVRATVQLDEEYAFFASDALIERSGEARPALEALKEAWTGTQTFCELPEGGRAKADVTLHLNVWALAEEKKGSILTATVRALTMDGRELARASFPVMGGDVRLAGVMELRTPEEEGAVIIRSELTEVRGGFRSRVDSVLLTGGAPEMEILAGIGQAKLSKTAGSVKNTGNMAAVAAGICLLPGEETDRAEAEWINT